MRRLKAMLLTCRGADPQGTIQPHPLSQSRPWTACAQAALRLSRRLLLDLRFLDLRTGSQVVEATIARTHTLSMRVVRWRSNVSYAEYGRAHNLCQNTWDLG